jgi:hypothetical protein
LPEEVPVATRELAEHLRAMLDEHGVSLRQLAGAEDVHYGLTSLHRYFSGRALPPHQLVQLLADRYGGDDGTRERLQRLYERASGSASSVSAESAPVADEPPSPAAPSRRRLLVPTALILLAAGLAGGGVAVGTGLLGDSSPEAEAQTGGELLLNGAFDGDSPDPWWDHGAVEIRTRHGALRIDVTGGTEEPWHAMVGHSGVSLREGAGYTLRFTASAKVAADIEVTVVREEQPGQSLANVRTWRVPLGPGPREYALSFDSTMTTDFGQVTFRFGGGEDDYTAFLDEVSLEEAGA